MPGICVVYQNHLFRLISATPVSPDMVLARACVREYGYAIFMDKAYYREYYDLERKHWWFRARAEILREHLRRLLRGRDEVRILNVGAATGRSTELLSTLGKVVSVEYDGDCCVFTRSQTGLELLQASVVDLPFHDRSFDLVCAFDVIEHVEDDAKGVAELNRVCRPDGLICVTVPAFMFLWSRHDDVNHHCRRYSGPQLRALLAAAGGEPVNHSYFNFCLFFPIAAFRLLTSMLPKRQRKDAGSDFFAVQSPLLDRVFYAIFRSEGILLRWGVRLPVGVSILSTWKKTGPRA